MEQNMEKLKNRASEMVARSAFGGADWLKVQSQHERFLREIENLPEEKKAKEMANAVNYLVQNKSDYWLECAHLLDVLLGDREKEGLYKIINPDITKKEFCNKYLNIAYNTAQSYVRVIRNYQDYGFSEDQIRVLGFGNTREILKKVPMGTISDLSKKNIEELKQLKRSQIYQKKRRTPFEKLVLTWEQTSEEDQKKFLRFINESRTNSEMG